MTTQQIRDYIDLLALVQLVLREDGPEPLADSLEPLRIDLYKLTLTCRPADTQQHGTPHRN